MMWWWNDYYSGTYWPMPWMMIIFVIICAAMMFFMMRSHKVHSRGEDALDILKERFARGEIDQNEYEQRRRLLGA